MKKANKTFFKGRNFLITLNQPDYFGELKDYLKSMKGFTYAIATKEEAPTTGHKHIHVYIQFGGCTALAKNKLCGARVDKCRGSAQQNINYIRKNNDPEKAGEIIWEEGSPLFRGGLTIAEVKQLTQEQRENLPFSYYKGVYKLNMEENMHADIKETFKEVSVKFIFGPSGLGKTQLAMKWLEDEGVTKYDIVSYENGFWNGVSETCEYAVYDDFRDTDMPPVMFIKFIDYTIKNLNIKGGFVKNKYKTIYITSVQDPRDIYTSNWEEKKQWIRRMEIYEFTDTDTYRKLGNPYYKV
jgi:hypothetical protein